MNRVMSEKVHYSGPSANSYHTQGGGGGYGGQIYTEHGYEEISHHSSGGDKKGVALSALTLLAFLFFLHILQTCLQEQMAENGTENTPIVLISSRNNNNNNQQQKQEQEQRQKQSNANLMKKQTKGDFAEDDNNNNNDDDDYDNRFTELKSLQPPTRNDGQTKVHIKTKPVG